MVDRADAGAYDFGLDEQELERARTLHADATVVDGLIPSAVYLEDEDYRDNLRQGGVSAGNFTVADYQHDFHAAVESVERHRDLIETTDGFALVESVAELRAAADMGEIGVILGFQDTRPVGPDRSRLHTFDRLGVRIVQLTYNEQNFVGAGCCECHDAGLSNFGRELVEACNDRGVLVDLSHCADQTTAEAIEQSSDPVVFSHVGVRELCPAPGRNKPDDQIRRVAKNGGVVGVSLFPPLVRRDHETNEVLPATAEDVLDAVDYLVDLVGVDHVGFGSDLNDHALDSGVTPPGSSLRTYRPDHPEVFGRGPTDTYDPYPKGLDRHWKLATLTRGLVARGYDDRAIRGILGENFCRVFETVWGG
jgi:membrane dipeptidase